MCEDILKSRKKKLRNNHDHKKKEAQCYYLTKETMTMLLSPDLTKTTV